MVNIVAVDRKRHAGKGWRQSQGFAFAATQTVVPLVGTGLPLPRFRCRWIHRASRSVCPDSTHVAVARTQLLRRTARTVARGLCAGGAARLPILSALVEGGEKLALCVDEDSGWIVDAGTNEVVAKFFERTASPRQRPRPYWSSFSRLNKAAQR